MPRQSNFSAQEYADMILLYGEARGSSAGALALYRERFPHRRAPHNARVIVNAFQRIRENRPIVPGAPQEGTATGVVNQEAILQHFADDPESSTRRAGRQLQLSTL